MRTVLDLHRLCDAAAGEGVVLAIRSANGAVSVVFADTATQDQRASVAAVVASFDPAAATPADVRAEYERRLLGILGARDLAHAAFIRADDNAEVRELAAVAVPTPDQSARIAELLATSAVIAALIERYNAVDALIPTPADFTDDSYWG